MSVFRHKLFESRYLVVTHHLLYMFKQITGCRCFLCDMYYKMLSRIIACHVCLDYFKPVLSLL
jgi:hypothetical protein